MKQLFSILLLFLIAKSYSQDTIYLKGIDDKKATSKSKALYYKVYNRNMNPIEVIIYYKNGEKIVKEHFSSLKPSVRNGEYETYFTNGKIDTKGTFKDGLMDGLWLLYNEKDNYIEQKINFVANLKEDSAFTINKYGKILKTEIYNHGIIINTIDGYSSISKPARIIDTTGVLNIAEAMPAFPGGTQELMNFINNNIKYPSEAREKELQGKIIIKFIVDTTGEVANAYILKDGVGDGGYCGKEALRVINQLPKWNPGMQKGKPVKVYYIIPITFKIVNLNK